MDMIRRHDRLGSRDSLRPHHSVAPGQPPLVHQERQASRRAPTADIPTVEALLPVQHRHTHGLAPGLVRFFRLQAMPGNVARKLLKSARKQLRSTPPAHLLAEAERERVLQMFVIAILVSIGLSLVLASTIANPLSDLKRFSIVSRNVFATTIIIIFDVEFFLAFLDKLVWTGAVDAIKCLIEQLFCLGKCVSDVDRAPSFQDPIEHSLCILILFFYGTSERHVFCIWNHLLDCIHVELSSRKNQIGMP